jgi:hypothetical protein
MSACTHKPFPGWILGCKRPLLSKAILVRCLTSQYIARHVRSVPFSLQSYADDHDKTSTCGHGRSDDTGAWLHHGPILKGSSHRLAD